MKIIVQWRQHMRNKVNFRCVCERAEAKSQKQLESEKKGKYVDQRQVKNTNQIKAQVNLLGLLSSNLEVDAISFSKEAKRIRE